MTVKVLNEVAMAMAMAETRPVPVFHGRNPNEEVLWEKGSYLILSCTGLYCCF